MLVLSVKDASAILQCTERYLSDEIRAKAIKAYFVARKYLIFQSDLFDYIKNHKTNLEIHESNDLPTKGLKSEKDKKQIVKNGKKR